VNIPDSESEVSEAEVIQFFDSVLVSTYEEWLAVLSDGEKYKNQLEGLTPVQRKNVKRFKMMMQNCL